MALPGIHVAIHTEELLLSAGPRQMEEARRLWGSVFEVVHLGVEDP